MEQQEKRYAIIDGAVEEELLSMLSQLDPPVSCLYLEPVQEELIELAPYLVQVTMPVKRWLDERHHSPWGIYLTSYADLKTLRQHLRKYLQVTIPDQEKPVFFRFYDPRVIWDTLTIMDHWTLHLFYGPIIEIQTTYPDDVRSEDFKAIRQQFPDDARSFRKLLAFSAEQYAQFEALSARQYIQVLAELMSVQLQEKQLELTNQSTVLTILAEECLTFCHQHDITDDRAIRGLTHLLIDKQLYQFSAVPEEWLNGLADDEAGPGYYRMEQLLLNQLGFIPV